MKNKSSREKVIALMQSEEKPIKMDFSKGLYYAGTLADEMVYTFHNGKKRGETTRFHCLDPHFNWKRGEITCVTGYPNHGKTEFVLQMMVAKSLHDKWRWVVFCPENFPPDELYDTLIHAYIGKSVDKKYSNVMTLDEYKRAIEWVDKYFVIVHPPEEHTIEIVFDYYSYAVKKIKADGCLTDPWNQMLHDHTSRDDQYLANKLSIVKRFTQECDICKVITVHPNQPRKKEDGSLPVPDQFSLNGGSMWNNKADNHLSVYRPYYHKDKSDNTVEIHINKIKKQKLVGLPGMVTMTFDRGANRYYEPNGNSPLHVIEVPWRKPYKDESENE